MNNNQATEIFCESKQLAVSLAFTGFIALFFDILFRNVFSGYQEVMTALFFIAILFFLLGLVLAVHPVSCLEINREGFVYKRGKKQWKASWDEVKELRLSETMELQIETSSGATKLIALSIIRKKGADTPSFLSLLFQGFGDFTRRISSHENEEGKELVSLLEDMSGKKSKSYMFKGWEKIR